MEEIKKSKDFNKNIAISTIVSVLIASITVIYFSLSLFNNTNKDDISKYSLIQNKETNRFDSLLKSINEYNKQLGFDSFKIQKIQNEKLENLDKRIFNIENSVTKDPDRLLKLQEINFEFKELQNAIENEKEINEIKFTNLKDRVDQIVIWTSGLLIIIIGSIIAFAINAFRKI